MQKLIISILFFIAMPASYAEPACYDKNQIAVKNFIACQLAANNDNAMAQYFLAQMYRKGEGVDKDLTQAEHWYRKAATQGNKLAQYNLGWMYDIGAGVRQSTAETLKWYGLAAAQGDQYAPFNIGTIYYRGEGVEKDFIKTYYWFDIAMTNGSIKAKKWRDRMAKRMSEAQIEEAKTRLQQWQTQLDALNTEGTEPSKP